LGEKIVVFFQKTLDKLFSAILLARPLQDACRAIAELSGKSHLFPSDFK
jgi:hypothetical protein